jgi:calcineurin-like phosphoesterase family protein
MTTTFCTADEHFHHGNIIELCGRPFSSVEEMDEAMIDRWNAVVGQHDTVYVVGDFAMGKIAESLPLALRLNGRKHLVPGNHDRVWSAYNPKKRDRWLAEYRAVGFTIEPNEIVLDEFLVCHFPYEGDSHDEDRYQDYRPVRRGHRGLIHGHIHEKWKVNGDQINVGVDVWDFAPVPFDEIKMIGA